MTYVSAKADEIRSRRRSGSLSGAIGSMFAAFAVASGAAAWLADFDPVGFLSRPAILKDSSRLSFDDRFSLDSTAGLTIKGIPPRSLDQSMLRELEIKLREAKGRLAQKLQSPEWRAGPIDEPAPSKVTAIPLPRSRPVETKFSDFLPGALASLAPDGGLLSDGPDLAALGYDNLTAVYDIKARVVYMPNGTKLEAHSGFSNLMDDPGHVNERNVGATPPNVYDLKPRERLFHGIAALRMIPVDDKGLFGRSGLLAHSYMMGPNGDSNGCVSIKDYEKFLKAFQNGEIKRLIVVASLADVISASHRSAAPS